MICIQTPSFGWSFQDGRHWLQNGVITNNELFHPVLFEISATYHTNLPINRSIPPHLSLISLLEYAVEKEHTGFRRVTGYGIIVSRGAASAMMFSFSTLLVTMSRNIITFLRETLIMNWIPFDSAIAFHKYVAVWALFFTGRVIRIGKIT